MKKISDIHVPQQMLVNTGEDEPVHDAQEKFFNDVLEVINPSEFVRQMRINVVYGTTFTVGSELNPMLSDDGIVSLIVCDVMLASMVVRRNDQNWIEASFALYVTEENSEYIRERVSISA